MVEINEILDKKNNKYYLYINNIFIREDKLSNIVGLVQLKKYLFKNKNAR
jgi:hypothetical protein